MKENTKICTVTHFLKFILFGVMIVAVLLSLSCSMCSNKLSSKSFRVFDDFVFVGSTPCQPSQTVKNGICARLPKHGTVEVPLPESMDVGIGYIFHNRGPVNVERFAIVDLPEKLKSAGITVVKAPKSSKDILNSFIGSPLFSIRIRDGCHEGTIFNQICPDGKWIIADYVLVWLK